MAKPTRSPLLGYNHNVKYLGRIYHVQTEDSGPTNPHLFTHLYYEGTILASKRHLYDRDLSDEVVRSLMQSQHKAILKQLKHADFDEKLADFFGARGELYALADGAPEAEEAAVVQQGTGTLDLDALPGPPETAPPPEPPPPNIPASVTGSGVYAIKRGGTRERPFVNDGRPRRATMPAGHAPAAVVVQRQVVVGTDGPPTPGPVTPQRTRRPAPPIPYVVKEGSHPTLNAPSSPRIIGAHAAVPPPRPLVPPAATSANAPRTSVVLPAVPKPPAPDLVSDKSLDEVILAYLSQGDGSPPKR